MDIDTDKIHGAASSPFFLGLLGGLVALKWVPGVSWKERVTNLIFSLVTAGIIGPAISVYFGLSAPEMQSAASFLVGMFGLNIIATLFLWIREMKLSDLLPWWKR